VATNGDDSNQGTLSQPFKTIKHGLTKLVSAGDALYIRAGTYSIGNTSWNNKNGTAEKNIVISGYENERPKLDPSGQIPGTGVSLLWYGFLNFSNISHVTIKNLEILNSPTRSIYLSNSHHVTFQDIWIHDTALSAIETQSCNDIIIENNKLWMNNTVNNYKSPGYRDQNWMGTITIRGPKPSKTPDQAGYVDSDYPYSENIIIRNNELYQSYGEGINIHGRSNNVVIEDNTIYDCWSACVYFLNSKNVLIQRNLVYHTNDPRFQRARNGVLGDPNVGIGTMKEGGPTVYGELKNITIINNLVKGFKNNFCFWANTVYGTIGYMDNTLIANNTFLDAHSNLGTPTSIAIATAPHVNTRFENNIISQGSSTTGFGSSDSKIVFSNNLWSSKPEKSSLQRPGDIYADPKIARTGSIAAGQLTPSYFKILNGTSPAINKAKPLPQVVTDYFKNNRSIPDIGAHEFGGSNTSPSTTPTATPIPTTAPTSMITPSSAISSLAFPGAVGFGASNSGGRGGSICAVTSLANSGAGTLRECASKTGARIVIFKTSGTISLASHIIISNPYIYIAGQTSPGGIQLKGGGIKIAAGHDVIIRGLMIRPGDETSGVDKTDRSGIVIQSSSATAPAPYNIIIDHNSIEWTTDESTNTWFPVTNVTFSNNIMAQALAKAGRTDYGVDTSHPYGPMVGAGGKKVTFYGNLIANNKWRNPLLADDTSSEVVNNLLYSWGTGSITVYKGGSSKPNFTNIISNVTKATQCSTVKGILIESTVYGSKVYSDNWTDVSGSITNINAVKSATLAFPGSGLTAMPVSQVESYVMANAGVLRDDAVDKLVKSNVKNSTLPNNKCVIDSQNEVGGWPTFTGNYPSDTDNDYLPDTFEKANGGNISPTAYAPSGYMWIEEYANSLFPSTSASSVTPSSVITPIATTYNDADVEPDGDVDVEDYRNILSRFGENGKPGWTRADVVSDGLIDIYDLNKVIAAINE